jgi:uncharacterized protein (DUF4415 family)
MKTSYDFSEAKRGAIVEPVGKTRVTLWLDDDVIAAFRGKASASGMGYQTEINRALREIITTHSEITLEAIRKVVREELQHAA